MTRRIRYFAMLALLCGCAPLDRPAPETAPPDAPPTPQAEEVVEVRADPSPATGNLGLTVASLGSVREPGQWLKTPLVAVPGRGRLTDPRTGRSVVVDLIPLDAPRGAGSQLSLAGFQALGVPITGLPELRVTGLGG